MKSKYVPRVDLLDRSREPSDAELAALMESVMEDVKARGKAAHGVLMENLKREVVAACERYGVSAERTVFDEMGNE
ncbi:MAG: hypothetical protein LBU45_05270 [Azoarcus sp.]|jgi:hypothetical protein|nr:hypothetical protein [Azoarcus sp.]